MTLRHLKWIAAGAPILLVVALELVRYFTVGLIAWEKRLALAVTVIALVLLFNAFMFRFIGMLLARLERQNQELLALHGAGNDIAGTLALDALLRKVVEQARLLVGARYGALSLVKDDGRIETFLTSGISDQERERIGPPPVGHGLLGVVLREGEHLRIAELGRDPRSYGFPPNHPPMSSLLAVPIVCKGPFVGNLYLTEKVGGKEFSEDDERTLERFAVQASIAIDNAYLHEQVADLAVAQERIRIAHEMHDGLAQVLGYVNTKAQAVREYVRSGRADEAQSQLVQLSNAAREAYTDVREGLSGLRSLPSPDQPIGGVLADYLQRWKEQSGLSTSLSVDGGIQLAAAIELQLVRIVQEALTNVRKHARASEVSVELRQIQDGVRLTVSDDGTGFDPENRRRSEFPRFGIATMRERAESVGGRLEIDAAPGRGTRVTATLPVRSAPAP
ncbi:MAG TPA: GAF domain-containing sensor histidine kinase [Thermoanaerobaculia bacterium]|nr:GAF domain-containing sensor histidine kinase [Thermoanaerobaculia bacterium]